MTPIKADSSQTPAIDPHCLLEISRLASSSIVRGLQRFSASSSSPVTSPHSVHQSIVPTKAVANHGDSAYTPSFTSDPQHLHTTPIIAPTNKKMNSDPYEHAGVAHDQGLRSSTLQAPSSPISVNNDSAHSSEMCTGELPILIENSDEEHADKPEKAVALQDRPDNDFGTSTESGGRNLDFRYQPSFANCMHLGKVATGSVASIGLAVIGPPVYAKWFPEYLAVGNLSSTSSLSICVVRRDRKGKLLPDWLGGGTFFPDSTVVKEFGYFVPSILLVLAEDIADAKV
ncbi:hypothetical protein TW65_06401 [Stemphylium lycopersici]|nr:hypothetical protein TW65_06401 [Stemphylium lycopersici]